MTEILDLAVLADQHVADLADLVVVVVVNVLFVIGGHRHAVAGRGGGRGRRGSGRAWGGGCLGEHRRCDQKRGGGKKGSKLPHGGFLSFNGLPVIAITRHSDNRSRPALAATPRSLSEPVRIVQCAGPADATSGRWGQSSNQGVNNNESRNLRSCRARGPSDRHHARRAAEIRRRRRRGRHLLPARRRASRHPAQSRAGPRHLSRRRRARHQAHASRAARAICCRSIRRCGWPRRSASSTT